MAVGLQKPGRLHPVEGIRLSAVHCGLKKAPDIKDLVLVEICDTANVAAVFTTNRFCAAPVVVAREHLSGESAPRFLLINSGNANAGTGTSGYQNALSCCKNLAAFRSLPASAVLPFSTGVIGAPLAVKKINDAIPGLLEQLDGNAWLAAAEGIMTTDTLPKAVSEQLIIAGKTVTITGIAKGSGMIKPDMATMLAFVATDAKIEETVLKAKLKKAVNSSFNAITVDGDTSTNDACVLIASGESGADISATDTEFDECLARVFQQLAQSVVRDGEGATKFIEIEVTNADSVADAREVAYTIAHSPLVKTALFASDPNWGRILAAVGRAKIAQLNVDQVDLYLGDTCLIENGLPDTDYREERGQAEMDKEHIRIIVNLRQGVAKATIWTSDLSYEYVKINAEYRS